ncbi:MAG TPA: CDP-diacylglycerol--serine O-phosphatidyltransferase [Desulfomonilaceae bacterium]|nr:CDP-diacylglycerol--serine O-phosphatidyltransferase [Desulfomonilaceae bacterium]
MARKRRPFFKKRRRLEGEDFAPRPPRRRIQINKMKKGIFILPSLLTLGSIFCAFYGTVLAIKQEFVWAAALILTAGFFDGIDGKVARLTKTTTRFGLELDSLADVISFGMAPAILMYMWVLVSMGRVGWISAFLFVACGALRLARFNVQSGSIDPKRFNGLPIPAAAAMVATLVLFFHKLELDPADFRIILLLVTTGLAFFMVSNIKFHAFKDLTLVKQKPFSSTVAFVLMLALIASAPAVVLFLLCAAYVVSGPVMTIVLYVQARKKLPEPDSEQESALQEVSPAENSGT